MIPAHHYPRATEFIPQMIKTIETLESKGYTYTADDGSVFFKISEVSNISFAFICGFDIFFFLLKIKVL